MKIKALVMLAAMLPTQAFGFTSLCAQDSATGFNWNSDRWVQTNFFPVQYIFDRIDPADADDYVCYDGLFGLGMTVEPEDRYFGSSTTVCYDLYEVGEVPGGGRVCEELRDHDGEIFMVICTRGLPQIRMEPNGEFVTSMFSAIPTSQFYQEGDERASIAVAVGKCSVISK
ncbi:hypothetical protein [Pelagibacterium sp.]|uniref:hypothetical protein n=1 Tax=Pelagibacterium sp. TaxID=1967288 RepID=UPI003BA96680